MIEMPSLRFNWNHFGTFSESNLKHYLLLQVHSESTSFAQKHFFLIAILISIKFPNVVYTLKGESFSQA